MHWFYAGGWVFLFWTSLLWAQPNPKNTIRLSLETPAPRFGAPFSVNGEIHWSSGIVQGDLELRLVQGGYHFATPIALAPGKKQVRLLLPSLSPLGNQDTISVQAAIRTKNATFPLGFHDLQLAPHERPLVILSATPEYRNGLPLAPHLRLDGFNPDSSRSVTYPSTTIVYSPTRDFPSHPLLLCAYDLVVLDEIQPEEFRQAQLEALWRWVEMGGSLCWSLPEPLRWGEHQSWRQRLPFSQSETPTADAALTLRPGLGRLVLWRGEKPDPDSLSWKETVAFLWKFRPNQSAAVATTGHWQEEQEFIDLFLANQRSAYNFWDTRRGQPLEHEFSNDSSTPVIQAARRLYYGFANDDGLSDMVPFLLPRSLHLLPIGLVIGLLLGFLFLVGPLEYYLLRRWQKRWLTWLSFPLLALLFGLGSFSLAQRYLGSHTQPRVVECLDLGDENSICRQTRFTLYFPSTHQHLALSLENGLFCPMRYHFDSLHHSTYLRSLAQETLPVSLHGQIPQTFRVSRSLRQWEPFLLRTTFAGAGESAPLQVDLPALQTLLRIKPLGRDEHEIISWNGKEFCDEDFPKRLPQVTTPHLVRAISWNGKEFQGDIYVLHRYQIYPLQIMESPFPLQVLLGLCRRQQVGYFSLVSQISPTGGENLEDLSLLDAMQANQFLLVLVKYDEGALRIYRRLLQWEKGA